MAGREDTHCHLTARRHSTPVCTDSPLDIQAIVNCYGRGDTLPPHVDLLRFSDGIALLSLEGECDFRLAPAHAAHAAEVDRPRGAPLTLSLAAGDVVLLSQEARWHWTHEVLNVCSARRVSLTLRHLPRE